MNKNVLALFVSALFLFSCEKYGKLEDGMYAEIKTPKGDVLVELYHKDTPLTCANFISLAEGTNPKVSDSLKGKKYYDGLVFHRVVPDFVIQGGDPMGNGSGGPGYKFQDEFPKDSANAFIHKHDGAGILSMANPGPNANGSQFFITLKATPWLDGKHSVFGKVVEGQAVVDSIKPKDAIEKVSIIRKGATAESFDAPKVFAEEIEKYEEAIQTLIKKQEEDTKKFFESMGIANATETDSGLKVLVMKEGKGKKVTDTSDNIATYDLFLGTGKPIQSTTKEQPFEFNFSKRPMIAGFTEGVKGLKKGSKVRLFIPYYLGYGEAAYGPFPAKSSLVFDVEILDVK